MALSLAFLVWAVPEFRSPAAAEQYYQQWYAASEAGQEKQPDETHFWVRELYGWAYAEDSLAQWLMAVLGLAATAVSIYALVWLRRTWDQARRSADAAFAAVEASKEQAAHAINSFAADQRPWLSIEGVTAKRFAHNSHSGATITIKVRNLGKTPALGIDPSTDIVEAFAVFSGAVERFANNCATKLDTKWNNRVIFPGRESDPIRVFVDDFDGEPTFAPKHLIVCLTYGPPSKAELFHTAFVIRVRTGETGTYSNGDDIPIEIVDGSMSLR